MSATKLVTLERLSQFKTLMGTHGLSKYAAQLETARTIDGVSFNGTANIELPTKIIRLWKEVDNTNPEQPVTTYYTTSGKAVGDVYDPSTDTHAASRVYIMMDDSNKMAYWNGSNFVNIEATNSDHTSYLASSLKGANNGVAELGADGKVPAGQLPSYVDDVVECYVTAAGDPVVYTLYSDSGKTTAITGETGKIYVDVEATVNGVFRWSGSAFVLVGSSVSNADRAVNDADGNPIKTTYMKEADYDDVTEQEINQLFGISSGSGGGE